MKKFAYAIVLCFIASQFMFVSAADKNPVFTFTSAVDSCVLFSKDGGGDKTPMYIKSNVSIIIPTTVGDKSLNVLIDSIGQIAFGRTGDLKKGIKEYLKRPRIVSDSDIKVKAVDKLPKDLNSSSLSTEEILGYVKSFSATSTVLTYCINDSYYYAGAAHGMHTTSYVNFYIPKGIVLTAENMFAPEKRGNILEIINAAAQKKYGKSTIETIESYHNFYLDAGNNTIVFVYQPYEVAPYSEGIVEVPVEGYLLYDGCLTQIGKAAISIR